MTWSWPTAPALSTRWASGFTERCARMTQAGRLPKFWVQWKGVAGGARSCHHRGGLSKNGRPFQRPTGSHFRVPGRAGEAHPHNRRWGGGHDGGRQRRGLRAQRTTHHPPSQARNFACHWLHVAGLDAEPQILGANEGFVSSHDKIWLSNSFEARCDRCVENKRLESAFACHLPTPLTVADLQTQCRFSSCGLHNCVF